MVLSADDDAVLSLYAFSAYLMDALELVPVTMTSEMRLAEDLGLDSLQMQELGLVMYELGAEVLEEMVPVIETVGDLYHHYVTRVTAERR